MGMLLSVLVHEFDNLPRLPHGEHDEVPEGKGSAKRNLAVLSGRVVVHLVLIHLARHGLRRPEHALDPRRPPLRPA